jgi:hypothetical protein
MKVGKIEVDENKYDVKEIFPFSTVSVGKALYYDESEFETLAEGCYIDWDFEEVMYFKDGLHHREEGPSIENQDDNNSWHLNGLLHRVGGPAIVNVTSRYVVHKEWFQHGLYHRDDGPAKIYGNNKEWYLEGHLVFDKNENNLHKFYNLPIPFKQEIVKYQLTIM